MSDQNPHDYVSIALPLPDDVHTPSGFERFAAQVVDELIQKIHPPKGKGLDRPGGMRDGWQARTTDRYGREDLLFTYLNKWFRAEEIRLGLKRDWVIHVMCSERPGVMTIHVRGTGIGEKE